MNMTTRNSIFDRYLNEYCRANSRRKKEILDHVVDVAQIHRKSAIRKLNELRNGKKAGLSRRGRKIYYTADVIVALKNVWTAANEPCGELLHPVLSEYVSILRRDDMWDHSPMATTKLLQMKEHTVRRKASEFMGVRYSQKGLSATRPSLLKNIIPIFKGPWNDLPPGHGQIDSVAHCGNTLIGDYAYTVSYIDAATYWIVLSAQWNKGQHSTLQSMERIEGKLPVPWLGAHPDSGGEFINWVAKEWFDSRKINLSRSEPNKKNDNMYIEERNGHVVRKYIGYHRLDDKKSVFLLNEIYDLLILYLNHFQAVRRTLSKIRVGAKIIRKYENHPKTPYQRMLEHPSVSKEIKMLLRIEHAKLNPLLLKKQLDKIVLKLIMLRKGTAVVGQHSTPGNL